MKNKYIISNIPSNITAESSENSVIAFFCNDIHERGTLQKL